MLRANSDIPAEGVAADEAAGDVSSEVEVLPFFLGVLT